VRLPHHHPVRLAGHGMRHGENMDRPNPDSHHNTKPGDILSWRLRRIAHRQPHGGCPPLRVCVEKFRGYHGRHVPNLHGYC
jgi:hypothetical protein